MAMPYFPASYANPYMPQMYQNQYIPQQQAQQQSGGLTWVQGIEAAKSYPVSAGQSILLMDSESNSFFIKSADASGMPLPLRVFDYTERNALSKHNEKPTEQQIDVSGFVTREEFEARVAKLLEDIERKDNRQQQNNNQKGGNSNGK
jgi:hypothetical protein